MDIPDNNKLLDNPIWNALNSNQANLASGNNLARIYPRDMLPMAGLAKPDKESFAALSDLAEPGRKFGICLRDDSFINKLPSDWKIYMQFDTAQMIRIKSNMKAPPEIKSDQKSVVRLNLEDVPQMQELAALTQPGPFTKRTIEFGSFYGIKNGDSLVAMAGQRMQLGKFTEISGVCTHPDFQGKGYARALVHEASNQMELRGEIPFLHVLASNTAAIKSYTACGFTQRCIMQFAIIEKI